MKIKRSHSLLVSILIVTSALVGAAEKERIWQQGKLAGMRSQH